MTRDIFIEDPNIILNLEKITVFRSGRPILKDVDLKIEKGEFYGLIGANGVGKTTLLKVILGLVKPDGGRVRLGVGTGGKRPVLGYVPQKIQFDKDIPLRAKDLVKLGLDGHKFGVGLFDKTKWKTVEEILTAVGASEFADARVGELSGGQQQKIMIAHGLIADPEILLLDEPLANLDLKSQQEVIGLVNQLKTERGIAILFSAHDMNPLTNVMDKVIYIANGKTAAGKVSEIINSETLSDLYGYPIDVLEHNNRLIVLTGSETEGLHHEVINAR